MSAALRPIAVVAAIGLSACSSTGGPGEGPGERAIARAEAVPVPAVAVDGELATTELPAYLGAQQKALRKALQPAIDAGLLRVGSGRDGSSRVTLAADAAFDTDSSLLRPETLLPIAAIAEVLQRDRASVLHIVAFDPVDGLLGERRAVAVASVLADDGAAEGRVRAEARIPQGSRERRIEFVFAPVIAGRSAQAWVPPTD